MQLLQVACSLGLCSARVQALLEQSGRASLAFDDRLDLHSELDAKHAQHRCCAYVSAGCLLQMQALLKFAVPCVELAQFPSLLS